MGWCGYRDWGSDGEERSCVSIRRGCRGFDRTEDTYAFGYFLNRALNLSIT